MVLDKMGGTCPRDETVRSKVSAIRFVYRRKSAELKAHIDVDLEIWKDFHAVFAEV